MGSVDGTYDVMDYDKIEETWTSPKPKPTQVITTKTMVMKIPSQTELAPERTQK